MFRTLIRTALVGVSLMAVLALSSAATFAASGTSYASSNPLRAGANTGTLAPGESQWFSFNVAQAYTVEQQKANERDGVEVPTDQLRLNFSDAGNGNVAHNSGFYIYDPEHIDWIMDGTLPPTDKTTSGRDITEASYWALGSPDTSNMGIKAQLKAQQEGQDLFLGRDKVWQGLFNTPGTYYVEVYNNSDEPMTYTLSLTGNDVPLMTNPS